MRHWPLFDLRVRTPGLELRYPGDDDLAALAELAADGVHDPGVMPFVVPWTDTGPAERARHTMQYHWRCRGAWRPDDWRCALVTVVDGTVVGTQELDAKDFAVCGEVGTGSWLGRRYQGRGIGTRMRAAVLHLAFAGIGARYATSGAFADNAASVRVSRGLGYRDDGISRIARRGEAAVEYRFRMSRADWAAVPRVEAEIEGLVPCLPLFGAG